MLQQDEAAARPDILPEPVRQSPYCPICNGYAECVAPKRGAQEEIRWCMMCGTLLHQGGRLAFPHQDQSIPRLVKFIRDHERSLPYELNIVREYAGVPLVREGGAE